jgi:hypothetical protein
VYCALVSKSVLSRIAHNPPIAALHSMRVVTPALRLDLEFCVFRSDSRSVEVGVGATA